MSDKALSWPSGFWLIQDLSKGISLLKNSDKISELELQNLNGVYSFDVLKDFEGLKSLSLSKSLKEINFKSYPLKEIWALSDY